MKVEAWKPRGLFSPGCLHSSSLILHPCSGIAGHLNIATPMDHFDVNQIYSVNQPLGAVTADGTRSVTTSNDYRCQEEGDFVYQARVYQLPRHCRSAFNQYALKRSLSQFLQDLQEITPFETVIHNFNTSGTQ